jgi:tRNA threonylcarbamoyladenosine biosynthesis protein TsaB
VRAVLALALDASSSTLSCALCEVGAQGAVRVLAEERHEPPAKGSDLLPAALVAVCGRAGRELAEVGGIAVGVGPGSFTGLRVGIAAAKALAYARSWPVAGASSLHALALGAAPHTPAGALIVATAEARKGELYAAAWRALPTPAASPPRSALPASAAVPASPELPPFAALERVSGEAAFSAAAFAHWLATLGERAVLVGPGAPSCAALLAPLGVDVAALTVAGAPATPSAAAVAALCAESLRAGRYDTAALFALGPNYLKPSEAEVALTEGRVGGLAPAPKS